MWRHLICPARWCPSLRRRQPTAAAGEGQARSVPYTAFRATRMPVAAPWHDRSECREANDGESSRDPIDYSPHFFRSPKTLTFGSPSTKFRVLSELGPNLIFPCMTASHSVRQFDSSHPVDDIAAFHFGWSPKSRQPV